MSEFHGYREFEVNVTHACNAVCEYCDRAIGLIHIRDSNVTASQAVEMVKRVRSSDFTPRKLSLAGGEPMLNPNLQAIVTALEPLKCDVRVLTNGVKEYELPAYNVRRRWIAFKRAPLDEKDHAPFFVSPWDNGHRGQRGFCAIQKKCGLGFEAFGFTMCPVAGVLGHILRKNPYHRRPVVEKDWDICRHCPHSLQKGPRIELYQAAKAGEIAYPSPTITEGLEEFRRNPIQFPRFAEEPQPKRPKPDNPKLPIIQPVGYNPVGKAT